MSKKVGCFYYPFFNENKWSEASIYRLDKGAVPLNSLYGSDNRDVLSYHVQLAKRYGIDFFIVSYNGENFESENIKLLDEICRELDFQYCIHYESLCIHKCEDFIDFTIGSFDFINNFSYLVDYYFSSNAYFKIEDRPALFLYAARGYRNEEEYLKDIREISTDIIGKEIFFVADIIWWGYEKSTYVEDTLNIEKKVNLYDAIYAYNFYDIKRLKNSKNQYYFLKESAKIYELYENLFKKKENVYPTIMPRYKDFRKINFLDIRPENGKFLKENFNCLKTKNKNILLINSFNEWFEDTQIEPCIFHECIKESSDSYDETINYRMMYLEIIKNISKKFKGEK